jgi:hypothetical protein
MKQAIKCTASALTVVRSAVLLLACITAHAQTPATLRAQEMAQCLPGEIVDWGDQKDRPAASKNLVFIYQHANAPAWFDATQVLNAIRLAAQAWSQCGMDVQVISADAALSTPAQAPTDTIRVVWSDPESRHNFGLANLGTKTLALGPAAFALLQNRNPAHDARQTLQMVISHEMGHFFGLMAHSRRCVDVTSYYDNGKGEQCLIRGGGKLPPGVEYRSVLPTACDIQRCRKVNGG